MKATNIRKGNVIRYNELIYRVMNMDHVTPGKGRAHIQTKEMQFLYGDGEGYHFMDTTTYDQVVLTKESIEDAIPYIVPDSVITVEWFETTPIGVELPPAVELKVVETPPSVKDATASAQRKPATLETGLVVQVPAFISEGETIKVSTLDGSYMSRGEG